MRHGRPAKARVTTPAPEPGDTVGYRTPEECQAAILEALVDGPLHKWQLRELLHEREDFIYQQLKRLRQQNRVRFTGHRRQARYALYDYVAPAKAHKSPLKPINGFKPPPAEDEKPATSWWLGLSRADFGPAIEREMPRMGRGSGKAYLNRGKE